MAQTFSMRRNKIEEKEVPPSELLAEFPLLKDPHEVIAELGRLQRNTQLRSTYNDTWHQWLPQITKAIKINATTTNIKRMKEIDVNTDLEDEDAGRLTLKVLYALAFILKDHKTKPEIDKLMTITPVTVDLNAVAANVVDKKPPKKMSSNLEQFITYLHSM
ncbi:uncharacterized protein [Dysidea avara]|uniref:uncharacterized protein n=1 Tax=Dysidea avara TaxID=196820 RepID=UPI003333A9BB